MWECQVFLELLAFVTNCQTVGWLEALRVNLTLRNKARLTKTGLMARPRRVIPLSPALRLILVMLICRIIDRLVHMPSVILYVGGADTVQEAISNGGCRIAVMRIIHHHLGLVVLEPVIDIGALGVAFAELGGH